MIPGTRMTEALTRVRFLFKRRRSGDLDDELRFHIEQATAANLAVGMSSEEARRRARIDFGGLEHTREETTRQHPAWLLATIAQDARYALRGFRRNPLFAFTVIATLALGIGASTAVFSVVDRILFRPLPYANADRLVSLGMKHAAEPYEFMMGSFFYDWHDRQTVFTNITAQGAMPWPCDLTERNPVRLDCIEAHADFLPTLGVAPILGRNFLPGDALPNAPRTVLLSYRLWQSRYNRDPAILNQLIQIDGEPVRVIGILPQDFEMPSAQPADVLLPRQVDVAAVRSGKEGETMRAFARLKPGVTIAQARASLLPVFAQSLTFAPPSMRNEVHLTVRGLRDRQMHDAIPVARVLLAAVLAVLLIVCANVASLFLTRNAARERELAVRAALGASRARLLRQSLTETLLLSCAGGIVGCALAQALLRVFIAIAPAGMPFLQKATLDLRILVAAFALSLISGIVCGILPALQRPRVGALAARTTGTGAQAALRRALVVAQIACSVLLLSGAALLLRSFHNVEEQNLGMQTGGVLTANIVLSVQRYADQQKQVDFFTRAETALRALPGVSAVAVSDSLPPLGPRSHWYASITIAGRPSSATTIGGTVAASAVTADYFRALGVSMLQGRAFTQADADAKDQLLILSRQLAARMFPNEDPVGQRLHLDADGPYYTVIGVSANVRNNGLTGANLPEYYCLLRNAPEDWNNNGAKTLIIRGALPPATIAPWVRQQIAAIDPTTPVDLETLDAEVAKLADRPRFETALLGFFALTGLLMAVIGLYGVTAYAATQRTQEVGVRMALGATRLNVLRLIAWEGARLIVIGGALGLAAALATAHLLRSMLFSIGPYDPLSFLAVAALLAIVALAATLIPARSAMKLDPVTALRYE
jgi:putative ABC transport system permease protein